MEDALSREELEAAYCWEAEDHVSRRPELTASGGDCAITRRAGARPAGNMNYADACSRYGSLLRDSPTFASVTMEELLDADALPRGTASALRERYLLGIRPPARGA